MKKILLSIIVISAVTFSGCKKFLDEKPFSFLTPDNFPRTAAEADIALRGVYAPMQGEEEYGDIDFEMFDYHLPMIASENCDEVQSYMIRVGSSGYSRYAKYVYDGFYRGVNYANALIEALQNNLDPAVETWVPVKIAEAKAIRAYYFFWLVRMFSDVPLKLEATKSTSEVYERTPADKVYQQIVADLKEAEDLLPEKYYQSGDPADGRITKGACKGILAQVYATMAGWRRTADGQMVQGDQSNWALAKTKAKEVLDNYENRLYHLSSDYTQIFKNLTVDIYNDEIMFDVPFTWHGGGDYGATWPMLFGPGDGDVAGPTGGANYGGPNVLREWVRELEPTDIRVSWNLANFYYTNASWVKIPLLDTSDWTIGKWRKWPDNDDSHQWYWANRWTNFPLLRLAEVKMLYAEAVNEVDGPTTEAYAQINAIRNRAGLSNLPGGMTKEQFRNQIVKENSIEFIAEGMRHFDLVRWGIWKQKMESRKLSSWMQNYGEANEKYINWPIPDYEMQLNSGWQQNK